MERRTRIRQHVRLPLDIVRVDRVPHSWNTTTKNISSGGGVCFDLPRELQVSASLEYVITLSSGNPPVRIVCTGKVVRCGRIESARGVPGFEIAATMATYRFLPREPADSKGAAKE